VGVTHPAAGLAGATCKTHTVADVIQAPFELLQEHLAGHALVFEAFSK